MRILNALVFLVGFCFRISPFLLPKFPICISVADWRFCCDSLYALRRAKYAPNVLGLREKNASCKKNKLMHFCSDPTCGGRNYILKWVFLFRQFSTIDIFIVEKCEWYR